MTAGLSKKGSKKLTARNILMNANVEYDYLYSAETNSRYRQKGVKLLNSQIGFAILQGLTQSCNHAPVLVLVHY